jgi:uncharacterized protein with ParB-like and HNH nuclease domain
MRAQHTSLRELIEGREIRYGVPLFQRPYSWGKKQWKTLWDDIENLAKDDAHSSSHFLGAIVTMQERYAPEDAARFTLIDGQQRLTTIFIFLALLRDKLNELGEAELATQIHENWLVNRFQKGDDHLRLALTQGDQEAFQQLVVERTVSGNSKIGQCYEYFEEQLGKSKLQPRDLRNAIASRLIVVSITLDESDNPYLVFESLNAKGMPLTQADLVRNHVLMKLPSERREAVYRKHWEWMQNTLGDEMTEFLRHYLMRGTGFVRQDEVYTTLKAQNNHLDSEQMLADIARFAGYYQRFIKPETEPQENLRRALERLKRLKATTIYPFLLQCYDDYENRRMTQEELLAVLGTLENYLIRRFVCGYPTNTLNKIFPLLHRKVTERRGNFVQALREELASQGYPNDREFRQRLIEFPLYRAGNRAERARLILERLEEFDSPREHVNFSELSVEHVMPQNLTDEWREALGDHVGQHADYVHRLGNLTLTAYNSELSNSNYARKRQIYSTSNVKINCYFQNVETWNIQAIEQRSEQLAEDALKVWNYFCSARPATPGGRVTGTRPYAVVVQGEEKPVRSWRDVLICVLELVYERKPEVLEKLAADGHLQQSSDGLRTSRRLSNGMYVKINRSAESIWQLCQRAMEEIGLTEGKDWEVRVY